MDKIELPPIRERLQKQREQQDLADMKRLLLYFGRRENFGPHIEARQAYERLEHGKNISRPEDGN